MLMYDSSSNSGNNNTNSKNCKNNANSNHMSNNIHNDNFNNSNMYIYDNNGVKMNITKDNNNWNALHVVCKYGHYQCIKLLLQLTNININIGSIINLPETIDPPINIAIKYHQYNIVFFIDFMS